VCVTSVLRCYHAMRMHSADYVVARCLSVSSSVRPSVRLTVRLSVTRQYFVEAAKHIRKLFSQKPNHSSFSVLNGITTFRWDPPNVGIECIRL